MKIIEIRNLKKYYTNVKAVDGISLNVNKATVFGFLGPNGAGKTTTISCMMGFIKPTDGSIHILGKNIKTDIVKIKNKIGYLSSDLHLYKSLTGFEHIRLIQGIRGKANNLTDLIDIFKPNLNVKVKNLSTGNKQKLGLILCLMGNPELLILDEPTRGLDPLLQQMFYDYILKYKADGGTVFMSSHNLSEVEKLCDEVAIIKDGKIVTVEKIESLKQKKIYVINAKFKELPSDDELYIEGVQNFQLYDDNRIMWEINGDVNKIMKKLQKYKLEDIEISHADLEKIFIEQYKK